VSRNQRVALVRVLALEGRLDLLALFGVELVEGELVEADLPLVVAGPLVDPAAAQVEDRVLGEVPPAPGDVVARVGVVAVGADVDGRFVVAVQLAAQGGDHARQHLLAGAGLFEHVVAGEEPEDVEGAVAHVAVVDVHQVDGGDRQAAAGEDVELDGDVVEVDRLDRGPHLDLVDPPQAAGAVAVALEDVDLDEDPVVGEGGLVDHRRPLGDQGAGPLDLLGDREPRVGDLDPAGEEPLGELADLGAGGVARRELGAGRKGERGGVLGEPQRAGALQAFQQQGLAQSGGERRHIPSQRLAKDTAGRGAGTGGRRRMSGGLLVVQRGLFIWKNGVIPPGHSTTEDTL